SHRNEPHCARNDKPALSHGRCSARTPAMEITALLIDPAAWVALLTLVVLEIVLGIDNLVFIAILSNKLPPEQQAAARRIGLILALAMRIALLFLISWLVTLQTTLFDLGVTGDLDAYGRPTFETAFS